MDRGIADPIKKLTCFYFDTELNQKLQKRNWGRFVMKQWVIEESIYMAYKMRN